MHDNKKQNNKNKKCRVKLRNNDYSCVNYDGLYNKDEKNIA